MQYVTTFERSGIEKGIQQGIQKGRLEQAREAVIEILTTRFKSAPATLVDAINGINDVLFLKQLLKTAVTAKSIRAFRATLRRQPSTAEMAAS